MIIIGYQGIGKSTLAYNEMEYIDLESSNFFVNGKMADDWYIPYCNIAINLSNQGYKVFVSSHEVVRNELSSSTNVDKMIVCPAIELKDAWIEKLKTRYENTKLIPQEGEKNYKAYMNALDRYADNIKELMSEDGFEIRIIKNIDYMLYAVIEE